MTDDFIINSHVDIFGNHIPISISIENTYKTSIDFNLNGAPYTFIITSWLRRGIRNYLTVFHDVTTPRDIANFGIMIEKSDGAIDFLEDFTDLSLNSDGSYTTGSNSKPMTHVQKINAIIQGSKDIMTCLNQIGGFYPRSIIEYSMWYRKKNHHDKSYSHFITLATCNCIVLSNFTVPNIQWQLIEFPIVTVN